MEIPQLTTSDTAQRGDDLHLSLACPECGASGWVRWASLQRGMSCPKCGCHFHVARNGQLQSDDDLPRVRFHCPRCHQAGAIPAIYRVRRAKCGACKLPLEIGPDAQLHGAKEAAEMRRAATSAVVSSVAAPSKFQQFISNENSHMRTLSLIVGGVFTLALAAAVITGAGALFASTPEGEVRSFTYACLAGDWKNAEQWLPENDDVARIEFQRWRGFYFTSILDKHRPAGDKVQIAVVRQENNTADAVFIATLRSPMLGNREIRQHWRERDGGWEFDVLATLAQLN
jgi:hypothetical protein